MCCDVFALVVKEELHEELKSLWERTISRERKASGKRRTDMPKTLGVG